ncbi:hypothetical protein WOLCODRAFT_111854, partial [Wolfiporia cocos MD-104 SS10]
MLGLFTRLISAEQRKRREEGNDKLEAFIKNKFGDKINEMLRLHLLATAPDKCGHGYAKKLVEVVTAQADNECRSTWLLSSNVANTKFYERFGFITVGEVSLGESNPTWTDAPIIMPVMVRE